MTALRLHREPRTPPAESVRRLDTLVSRYTGIVHGVEEYLRLPDEPRLVKLGCESTRDDALLGSPLEHLEGGGGGAHPTREAARAAAIGEVAERYSVSYVPEGLPVGTAAELGPRCVDPARFALFSERQHRSRDFPFRRFDRDARVRWAPAWSLPDGLPIFVPAQLVYFGEAAPDEVPIGYATSNGLACGASFVEAALAALLELVERDAFMIAWSNRLSLPRLDWRATPELVDLDRLAFRPTGLRYSVVDLSALLDVPAALGVVHGDAGSAAALGVGAGCAPTIEEAWLKALSEAFAVRTWARTMNLLEPAVVYREDFDDVVSFADHIRYYADADNAAHASFLDAAAATRVARDVAPLEGDTPLEWIEAVARRLAAVGCSAYAVDVTSPDVRAAGLAVVKVIAPELCALDVAYRLRFLGGRRLYDAAFEAGLRPAPLTEDDVNPYPHPFP
jgi:ribosomal protein S12 methylthiotransferase accessory factor